MIFLIAFTTYVVNTYFEIDMFMLQAVFAQQTASEQRLYYQMQRRTDFARSSERSVE